MPKDAPAHQVPDFPRNNNLEWLRLIFATQVVFVHGAEHFGFKMHPLVACFPGVPAFFFVSGFLIYASYINAPGGRYFINRFLRLFPGLLFVTLGGVALALYAHGPRDIIDKAATYGSWILAQLTLGQAYNPSHFRDVGVGVINGSLWTITTEITFYLLVPVIVFLERRVRHSLWVLMAASFLLQSAGHLVWTREIYRGRTFHDLLSLTPATWGWMFGFGILAVRHFDDYRRHLKHFYVALPCMLAIMACGRDNVFLKPDGNHVGLLYFVCYAGLILWMAFGVRYVRLPFDLSYGVYIWHMPVINLLMILSRKSMWLLTSLTFGLAAVSWFFVEKPALRMKKRSLKPVA